MRILNPWDEEIFIPENRPIRKSYNLHTFKGVSGTPLFCKREEFGSLDVMYVGFSIGSTAASANSKTTLFLSIENHRRWITDVLEDESRIHWRILTGENMDIRLETNSGRSSIKIFNDCVPIIIHLFIQNKII